MAEGPGAQRGQGESQSWAEWTEQLQAYVAWVNSQLKKRAGCRIVSDLRRDMQDGVAFAQLVEILSGETLLHVDYSPNSLGSMKQNVEIVLQFMQTHRIRMHQTSAKDIVEGNLKAVMRLILALAAYFKPSSVKSSAQQYSRSQQRNTSVAAAAGAAAALADARKDAASAGRQYHSRREPRHHGDVGRHRSPASTPDRQPPRYEDLVRSPPASMSPQSRPPTLEPDVLPRRDSDSTQGLSSGDEGSRASWQDLLEQHLDLESQVEEAKETVAKLQHLLLEGEEEGEGVGQMLEGVNPEEHVVLLQSRLDQREVECDHLRKDLSRAKQENMNLHGTKVGLQSRLAEQDNSLLEMKNELLRLGFVMEQFEADKAELQRKVDEKNKMLTDLRRQLTEKDRQLDEQQAKLEEAERKLTQANSSKAKDNVSSSPVYNGVPAALPPGEELQVVREALRGLRSCFQVNNPQHHTIDTLEQSIATLMERLRFLESQRLIANQKESLANRMKPASPKPQDIALSPTSRQRSNGVETNGSTQGTKILYFTEKTVTPFMTSISKKLGDITLRDFKEVFDRQGSFRFHFKALDPEFGTVKEEVCQDEDIIPGWEGKIVAWIEEVRP
ncbi:DIXDC1 [Branchiostoma lanceolatum]|uniref:DIXDC1 protein n=1 Tax=Branchiostoma lanceolatum TaxID=7740 RepID=A0A8K0EZA2_BRALA|nr:DIXDC1 [Branchiostoma lanceolatum]